MPLQNWARRLGLGRPTGIDLPGRGRGAECRRRQWREPRCVIRAEKSAPETAPWSVGDNVNLSVGQGDLAANPLQMAVAYAAIANGGSVSARAWASGSRTPAAARCRSSTRRRARSWTSRRSTARRSSTACAAPPASPGGTSSRCSTLPVQVAGKTGTAEKGARSCRPVLVRRPGARGRRPQVRGGRHLSRPAASAPTRPRRRRGNHLRAVQRRGEAARPGRRPARLRQRRRSATAVQDFRESSAAPRAPAARPAADARRRSACSRAASTRSNERPKETSRGSRTTTSTARSVLRSRARPVC